MEVTLKLNLNEVENLSYEYPVKPQIIENIKKLYGSNVHEAHFKELAKIIFVSCNEDELEDYEAHAMLKSIEESIILNAICQRFHLKV